VIAKARSPEREARERQLDPASLRRSASNATLDLWRAFLAQIVAEPRIELGQRGCGVFLIFG
jgi:hypothetical protein